MTCNSWCVMFVWWFVDNSGFVAFCRCRLLFDLFVVKRKEVFKLPCIVRSRSRCLHVRCNCMKWWSHIHKCKIRGKFQNLSSSDEIRTSSSELFPSSPLLWPRSIGHRLLSSNIRKRIPPQSHHDNTSWILNHKSLSWCLSQHLKMKKNSAFCVFRCQLGLVAVVFRLQKVCVLALTRLSLWKRCFENRPLLSVKYAICREMALIVKQVSLHNTQTHISHQTRHTSSVPLSKHVNGAKQRP